MDRHDDCKDYGKLFLGLAFAIGFLFIAVLVTL